MKKMKILFLALLLLFGILTSNAFIEPTTATSNYCNKSCGQRCALAGVKDRCVKYCGICCEKCRCVPSGTYGNKHQCPCYRDMRNSKGKPKCP